MASISREQGTKFVNGLALDNGFCPEAERQEAQIEHPKVIMALDKARERLGLACKTFASISPIPSPGALTRCQLHEQYLYNEGAIRARADPKCR